MDSAQPAKLNVIDYEYDGIFPREKQFYLVCNQAATTNLRINITALEFEGWQTPYPDFKLSIYRWDAYIPDELRSHPYFTNLADPVLVDNESNEYYSAVEFQCVYREWYIVEVFNEDFTDDTVYNITFQSDTGVPFQPYNYLPLLEKDLRPGYITISYYENSDPWLYDYPTGNGRLTLMMDYSLSDGLYPIGPSGYRYFTLYNNVADAPVFIGVTGYPLSYYEEYPQLTIYISDWENIDAGIENSDEINFNILNYSCGIYLTVKSKHTYQITVHNGDPDYDVIVNLTFWSMNGLNIRYDYDLEPEPENDQLRVRAYAEDPWLEARRLERNLWMKYIFGGAGIGLGVAFILFFLKRRYS
jgi:hypothetical protein